jgi:hypothetical protein
METVLYELEAELNLLGDPPSGDDLEHLQIYQQSLQVSVFIIFLSDFIWFFIHYVKFDYN